MLTHSFSGHVHYVWLLRLARQSRVAVAQLTLTSAEAIRSAGENRYAQRRQTAGKTTEALPVCGEADSTPLTSVDVLSGLPRQQSG